jgi:hypothetical protein
MRVPHVIGVVILFLSLMSMSCSSHQKAEDQTAASQQTGGTKVITATVASEPQHAEATKPARLAEKEPATVATRVRLTPKGCVEFEPHWSSIKAGQSISWRSELKTPVVIHVSAGAFEKNTYTVRAGATVSTGPALASGSYSIWTEPTACQGVPRGVQSSGPGLTVQVPAIP